MAKEMKKMPKGNYIPWPEMTPEQKHEYAVLGGKARAKQWKEQRELGKLLLTLLETKTETGNVATDMCVSLLRKAMDGDTKAFEIIRDTVGQKPKEKVEAKVESDVIKVSLDDTEESR